MSIGKKSAIIFSSPLMEVPAGRLFYVGKGVDIRKKKRERNNFLQT